MEILMFVICVILCIGIYEFVSLREQIEDMVKNGIKKEEVFEADITLPKEQIERIVDIVLDRLEEKKDDRDRV